MASAPGRRHRCLVLPWDGLAAGAALGLEAGTWIFLGKPQEGAFPPAWGGFQPTRAQFTIIIFNIAFMWQYIVLISQQCNI